MEKLNFIFVFFKQDAAIKNFFIIAVSALVFNTCSPERTNCLDPKSNCEISNGPDSVAFMDEDYTGWNFSQSIFLNTTPTGANVSGDVTDFPLLIRLNSGNFNFNESTDQGSDLRFADEIGAPLKYEIENWDSVAEEAEVWVKIPVVYGNRSDQFITQYWGKNNATEWYFGEDVFETANGFTSVWHLNELGSGAEAEFKDATNNQNHSLAWEDTAIYFPAKVPGLVGGAQEFDGADNYIDCGKKNSLDLTGNSITLSAWVKYNTPTGHMGIVSKSGWFDGYRIYISEFHDVIFELTGVSTILTASGKLTADVWYLVSGTYDGMKMRLYINGQQDSIEVDKTEIIASTQKNVRIGHGDQAAVAPWIYPFNGIIDEVRISGVARSADWIKLCYINQRPQGGLTVF